jgi:multisubunit Na+/H+ antiporter MnhB subunit
VVFPAGGAILALAAQLFVLVPIYATVKWRAKEPFLRRVAIWLGVSVAAVLIPGLFIKL